MSLVMLRTQTQTGEINRHYHYHTPLLYHIYIRTHAHEELFFNLDNVVLLAQFENPDVAKLEDKESKRKG